MADVMKRKAAQGLAVGRGMTDELSLSPVSDCNSNNVETSYTSNTSELEFIQDNSDYQWCVDYGYREVASHRSILSSCYDELARDLDSQLAQVDMEDYSAQEILSTLPAICCPGTTERQGEMFASVSGSLMVKFEFDSSLSPHTSSQDESSMSLCQSEPLFSPVKEAQLPNYSVDSLDEGEQLIVTCQANKTNYTIAFHGSTTLLGDTTSEYTDTGESMASVENEKHHKAGGEGCGKMTASDAPRTTWSKLRRGGSETRRSRSKTVSLPDLGPQPGQLSASLATNLGGCVKLYDINSSSVTSESFSGSSSGGGGGGSGGGKQTYFSLLRMFIAQRTLDQNIDHNRAAPADSASSDLLSACYEDSLVRESDGSSVERISSSKDVSVCTCSIQSATDSARFNVNNNNSLERPIGGKVNAGTATSGSDLSAATTSSDPPTGDTRLCPVHRVDRAIQTSIISLRTNQSEEKSFEDKEKKPVYVLYPNYTLPDLGFLRGGPSAERVLLAPVPFSPTGTQAPPSHHPSPPAPPPYRRVTRNDVEALKKKGVGHVMDWSSLAPLLPSEYWPVLSELPQVEQHLANRIEKPTFVQTTKEPAPIRDTQTQDCRTTTGNSSGWSTGTAPSSGYRGSSTLLSESGGTDPRQHNNPLYVYNYSEERRAAGPKHGVTLRQQESKRYSMFEFGGLEDILNETDVTKKRKSFPAQQPKSGHGEAMEPRETECWEDWWRDTAKRPHSPPSTHATRLDHLLELSGEAESWRPQEIRHLRDQVSRALCEVGRGKCVSFADRGGGSGDQQLTPPNSPTNNQKPYQCKQPTFAEVRQYPEEGCRSRYDFTNKKKLLERIGRGVEKVVACVQSDEVSLAQTVLDSLCPPLYSLLTDGLRPRLETAFGPIGNSVWQVVEASAQQGPMTRALHELVLKLNSEDVLSEGLIKFNAFIFGLLNVHGMDAWMSYIRTRESILSKHYTEESLLLSASRGHAKSRCLTDQLLASLKPLSRIDFHLDLLYETRLLHESLLQLAKLPLSPSSNMEMTTDSFLLKKIVQSIKSGLSGGTLSSGGTDQSSGTRDTSPHLSGGRPRSCVDPSGGGSADIAKKRWSGVQVGSRLVSAFDRLQSPEQDSLEVDAKSGSEEGTSEADEERKTAGKFRSLQRKWELLSGRTEQTSDSTLSGKPSGAPRSRIPRPVTSPVRPLTSRLPTPVSVQRRALSSAPTHRSRELEVEKVKWRPRPTTGRQNSGGSQKRTGLSTPNRGGQQQRTVVTLTHRLPTDSGHLAFNEGERLRLVLEVDDAWLLCCRGDAKGLVPRSAVI